MTLTVALVAACDSDGLLATVRNVVGPTPSDPQPAMLAVQVMVHRAMETRAAAVAARVGLGPVQAW